MLTMMHIYRIPRCLASRDSKHKRNLPVLEGGNNLLSCSKFVTAKQHCFSNALCFLARVMKMRFFFSVTFSSSFFLTISCESPCLTSSQPSALFHPTSVSSHSSYSNYTSYQHFPSEPKVDAFYRNHFLRALTWPCKPWLDHNGRWRTERATPVPDLLRESFCQRKGIKNSLHISRLHWLIKWYRSIGARSRKNWTLSPSTRRMLRNWTLPWCVKSRVTLLIVQQQCEKVWSYCEVNLHCRLSFRDYRVSGLDSELPGDPGHQEYDDTKFKGKQDHQSHQDG